MPRTIRTKVYQFNELPTPAQFTAITDLYKAEDRKVKIRDSYEYRHTFTELSGIVVKIMEEGANVWLPVNMGGNDYSASIFWFPFNCLTPTNNHEFTSEGKLFNQ